MNKKEQELMNNSYYKKVKEGLFNNVSDELAFKIGYEEAFSLHVVGKPEANSCICAEMTKQGIDSWHCRGCGTHWE